jgi:hypothetical protein
MQIRRKTLGEIVNVAARSRPARCGYFFLAGSLAEMYGQQFFFNGSLTASLRCDWVATRRAGNWSSVSFGQPG